MPICILTEQNDKEKNNLRPLSIQIKKMPDKMDYVAYDNFDPTGMIVTATYGTSNIELSTVEITNYITDEKVFYDKPVKITYIEKGYICTTELKINVSECLETITITNNPNKLEYIYGDEYDLTGIEILGLYMPTLNTKTIVDYTYTPKIANQLGTQAITISATDGSNICTTTLEVIVKPKPITKPSIISNLNFIYNNSLQSISANRYWNNYNSDYMIMSGTSSAINAGTYTVTFNLKENYCWDDNTTFPIDIDWTINKATGSLTVTPTTVAINNNNYNSGVAVTITRTGDGAISYSPTNISGLTLSLSGNTLTIKGNGSTAVSAKTITINVAAGTNYTAPSSKTITVSAEYWSWGADDDTVDAAWFAGLKNYLQSNSVATINAQNWIGKTKSVTLTSAVLGTTTHSITCIDVNKDGNNTVTFQTTNMLNDYLANGFGNSPIYSSSYAKTECQNYYNAFPGKASIKTVSKGTNTSYNSSSIVYTDEAVFTPSIHEMGLTSYSYAPSTEEYTNGVSSAYSYYSNNNSRIKKKGDSGSANYYWTRSRSSYSTSRVCRISNTGGASGTTSYSSTTCGLAPAFVIG